MRSAQSRPARTWAVVGVRRPPDWRGRVVVWPSAGPYADEDLQKVRDLVRPRGFAYWVYVEARDRREALRLGRPRVALEE